MTKFRARLLLHGKERLALESSLRLAGELGMLDAPAEQIVDSTPMLGAAATQDTVRLVRHGVEKLVDAVAAVDEQAARALVDGLEFDYEEPGEVEDVAQDVNRFLRGWAGYFQYGNSANAFDKITLHAQTRMAGFIAKRHKQRTRYGSWVLRHSPDQIGLISLNGTIVAPRPHRPWRQGR